jgi:hypothetical protein
VCTADNLATFICRFPTSSMSFYVLERSEPDQACMGFALPSYTGGSDTNQTLSKNGYLISMRQAWYLNGHSAALVKTGDEGATVSDWLLCAPLHYVGLKRKKPKQQLCINFKLTYQALFNTYFKAILIFLLFIVLDGLKVTIIGRRMLPC